MLNGVRLPLSSLAAYYPWGRWDAAPPPSRPRRLSTYPPPSPPTPPPPALPAEILSRGTMKRHLPLLLPVDDDEDDDEGGDGAGEGRPGKRVLVGWLSTQRGEGEAFRVSS